MRLLDLQAMGGTATLALLAGLCLFLWKRLGYTSAFWFATGYGISALGLLFGLALDVISQSTPPLFLTSARFITTALFSTGLVKLAGLDAVLERRWLSAILTTLVVGYLAGVAWQSDYAGFAASILLAQMEVLVLFAVMAARQPNSGYALVCGALALFPLSALAYFLADMPIAQARLQAPAIYTLVTMTAFTVRMLRERAQVMDAQARLQAFNEELDAKVEARIKELEETVHYQDGFNRSVAHDLRGPIGAIAGYAQILVERLGEQDLSAIRQGLPLIANQAQGVVQTVNALLRLAKASDVKLNLTPTVMEQVVRSALRDVDSSQHDALAGVTISVQPLPTRVVDADLLKQLYTNLLGNAVKFTAGRPGARVEVGCESTTDGALVFFVRDNGAGFDPARAGRLFEPFVRLHGKAYEGTGVGLSICKRIIARHAGTIWAESQPNVGTTICFTLGTPERPVDVGRKPWYVDSTLPTDALEEAADAGARRQA